MKPIVGIRSLFSGISVRDLLLVDQIHVIEGINSWSVFDSTTDQRAADWAYLEDNDVLVRVPHESDEDRIRRLADHGVQTKNIERYYDRRSKALKAKTTPGKISPATFELWKTWEARTGRLYALDLEHRNDVQPVSLLDDISALAELSVPAGAQKAEVLEVLFKAFPVPTDDVPLEQLLDFRRDEDARTKLTALRHWMNKMAREQSSPAEIAEELESLLFEYQRHMRVHRLKHEVSTLQVILTTPFKVMEELVRFKFGTAVEALFALRKQRLDLMEAELTAPGKEVAYISRAMDLFSNA